MQIDELKPVIRTNLADIIIEQIITLIKEKKLKDGEKLFSERKLAERFEVSRVTVREALKRLEQIGLIVSQARGGFKIRRPSADSLIEPLMGIITFSEEDNKNIIEVRRILEVNSIPLICKSISSKNIEEIYTIIENMEKNINDYDLFSDYDYFFHLKLAQTTNNPVLFGLLTSIRKILREEIKELAKFENNRKNTLKLHKLIIEAIEKKEVEEAKKFTNLHFDNVEDAIRKRKKKTKT